MANSTSQVWFITGAASGIGRNLTELTLENGDIVFATQHTGNMSDLTDKYPSTQLVVSTTDVSDASAVKSAFTAAVEAFGHIDVVFNNASIFQFGEAEDIPQADARKLFDVNFWGAINVAVETIRIFRDVNGSSTDTGTKGGRLLNVSSVNGFVPSTGGSSYSASKFALEGWTDAMREELDPSWNIKITNIELGGFRTGWDKRLHVFPQHPSYTKEHIPTTKIRKILKGWEGHKGDPVKAAKVIYFKLAKETDPPKTLVLGKDAIEMVEKKLREYRDAVKKYRAWSDDLVLDL